MTRRVLLVRHASAGHRARWPGDDRARPLDAKGRRQAETLVRPLRELGADRLLSSPYVRCVETLEPAAADLGLRLEQRDELAEGGTAADVLSLVAALEPSTAALCTHGDMLDALLPGHKAGKGSIWVVGVREDEIRADRYLPPA